MKTDVILCMKRMVKYTQRLSGRMRKYYFFSFASKTIIRPAHRLYMEFYAVPRRYRCHQRHQRGKICHMRAQRKLGIVPTKRI